VALAFAPDGNRLAAATLNNGVQLWDLGEIRRELREVGLDWEDSTTPAIRSAVGPEPPASNGSAAVSKPTRETSEAQTKAIPQEQKLEEK
jgi:hypothetical protein